MLCALGNDIPVFDSEDCLFYFETFGVSQDLLSLVEYQYGISSILSGDSHSRFRMANTLIAHGFDVNWLNESNSPPLHSAIIHDDFEAFKWLMQQGANKDLYCPKVGKNATEFWIGFTPRTRPPIAALCTRYCTRALKQREPLCSLCRFIVLKLIDILANAPQHATRIVQTEFSHLPRLINQFCHLGSE